MRRHARSANMLDMRMPPATLPVVRWELGLLVNRLDELWIDELRRRRRRPLSRRWLNEHHWMSTCLMGAATEMKDVGPEATCEVPIPEPLLAPWLIALPHNSRWSDRADALRETASRRGFDPVTPRHWRHHDRPWP